MGRKRILFLGGSLNQTTMMHKISRHLSGEFDCRFTPYYCTGGWKKLQSAGLLDFTIIGGQNRRSTEKYFKDHALPVDYAGESGDYDLYLTCTDLMVQENLIGKNVILVQEGMTDPENLVYQVVKRTHRFGVPRWLASTSTTGLSDAYTRFCVASEGYRRHFVNKGVKDEKIRVTGIPNFDHCEEYRQNDFPHRGYVLCATTDTRENFKWDNRRAFIRRAVEVAQGKQIIFRLHPNENVTRSAGEVNRWAPGALVYSHGNTNHMIANCDTLMTQYSSTAYVGLALGKTVYSYFDMDSLKQLIPMQNGGTSGKNIADVCRELL